MDVDSAFFCGKLGSPYFLSEWQARAGSFPWQAFSPANPLKNRRIDESSNYKGTHLLNPFINVTSTRGLHAGERASERASEGSPPSCMRAVRGATIPSSARRIDKEGGGGGEEAWKEPCKSCQGARASIKKVHV